MYFNQDKTKSLHENKIQFPEDLSGTKSVGCFISDSCTQNLWQYLR